MKSVPITVGALSFLMLMQAVDVSAADAIKVSVSCKTGSTCSGNFPAINSCDRCEVNALSCTWESTAVERIDLTVFSRIDDTTRFVLPRVLSSDERKAKGMADGVFAYPFQSALDRFKITFRSGISGVMSGTCYLSFMPSQ